MEGSRSSSPVDSPQDLWSSILDSVSSSRSIPAKQVILLGEPSSGKSTIAAALLKKSNDEKELPSDFVMGYDWADVKDEGEEDTLARLSVYTVPSSSQSYLSLLPHFVPPRSSLPHAAVVIVLDWTKPWTFVEQLETWLRWVDAWVKGDGSRELDVMREENCERLRSYLQHYTEPTSETLPTTSTLSNTLLPLGPGTFTHNSSGVPIVVVCAKADLIDDAGDPAAGASGIGGMVKGKSSEWEEQTDGIMQVLRVICLKYGAALFYTTLSPLVLHNLRRYVLHMLFIPPPDVGGFESVAPHRNPFPFTEKANALDRDRILIPAGWDSWGKVAVLREGLEIKIWSEAWDRDMDPESDRQEPEAKALYAELVPDRGPKPHPLPPFNEPIPEQNFLAKNYDENAKKGDKDPRAAFRNQNEMPGQIAAGIVGPMGSSSFNLPHVERALTEMGDGLSPNISGDRESGRRNIPSRTTNTLSTSVLGQSTSSTGHSRAALGASTLGGSPSPTSGQSQHDVLQSFFKGLLDRRDRGASSPSVSRTTSAQNGQNANTEGHGNVEPNGTSSGAE